MRDDGVEAVMDLGVRVPPSSTAPAAAVTDAARLDALRRTGLLAAARDPAARAAFDRLARLTTRLLGVPTALVSLVDVDRQVFVGCVGLDGPAGAARETPLSHSLCQYVVADRAPVLIADARTDPRAAAGVPGHGAVHTLGVVAYAGVPLVTPDGHVLGALCAIDGVPRRWSDDDVAALTDLAAAVMAEVELRASDARSRALADERAAAQARYRTLLESLDTGFCVIEVLDDAHGRPHDYRYLEANPMFWRQSGLPPDMVGRRIREVAPDLEARWPEAFGRVAAKGEPARLEDHVAALGRWFDVFAYPIDAPELRRVGVLFTDVTAAHAAAAERERLLAAERDARATLEVERGRLAGVFREAPAFLHVLAGPDFIIELANEAYHRLVGRRDLVGRPAFVVMPEAAANGFPERIAAVMATGEPFVGRELPVMLARTPGAPPEERFVDLVYVPLIDPDGACTRVLGHGMDVTDAVRVRRDVERLLAESERARGDAVAARAAAEDARGVAERARTRTALLQGLTAALAGARTLDDVADVVVGRMTGVLGARTGVLAVPTADGTALTLARTAGVPADVEARMRVQPLDMASPMVQCFRTRGPVWVERRDGPDGFDARYPRFVGAWDALGVASAAYVPLLLGDGAVGTISFAFPAPRVFSEAERAFYRALGQQASLAMERGRLFDAERTARAEAERANRTKAEFLATMSHELRTPLNAIGGYAELMALGIRGPVTPDQLTDLERIARAQRHLLGLINGVLNYAKIDAGAVRYDLADVPLDEVLRSCEALVEPQVRQKELLCTYDGVDPALRVRADREKVQQVVLNLLSNAIKFTGRGGRVTLAGGRAAGGQAAVTVTDTGVGIAADQMARVFEPFVQVDSAYTRAQEGTGLGLAISRDLARGMGGDLTAESTPGAGSVFTLTLPAAGG